MTYTPDIPKSGESLGGTRLRIDANFQDINTFTSVNHYGLIAGSNIGKHSRLDLPIQSTFPATPVNEGWVQAQDTLMGTFGGGTNTAELAWRGEGITDATGENVFFLSAMPIRASFFLTEDGVINSSKTPSGRSFNITSINRADAGTATYTIVFTKALLSTDYLVFATYDSVTTGTGLMRVLPANKTTAQLTISTGNTNVASGTLIQMIILGG